MDINIKYDINDISAQLVADVKKTIDKEVTAEIQRFTSLFRSNANALVAELSALLDIKDNRQRERVKKAVINNLDKWTKRGL